MKLPGSPPGDALQAIPHSGGIERFDVIIRKWASSRPDLSEADAELLCFATVRPHN
jgi:hypothetical protein